MGYCVPLMESIQKSDCRDVEDAEDDEKLNVNQCNFEKWDRIASWSSTK